MLPQAKRTRGIPGIVAVALVILAGAPQRELAAQQPPAPAQGPKHYSAAAISPNGAWLAIALRRMEREKITTGGRPIETWRASSYRVFKVTSLGKKPKTSTLVLPAVGGYTPDLDAMAVLDDGTVVGVKGQSHIAMWDKAGKFQEKEVFQGSGFSSSLAVLPGGKEVLVSSDPYGDKDPINEIFDLKTLKLEKPAFLQGLSGQGIGWTEDERHLFAAESTPGKKLTVKNEDGTEITFTPKAWRLVRVA